MPVRGDASRLPQAAALPVRVLQNFRIEVPDHEEQEDNQRNGSCESQPVAPVFQLITGARLCVNVSLSITVK